MSEQAQLCAYCNKPAAAYIMPRPINGKTFNYIPICGTKCRQSQSKKKTKI